MDYYKILNEKECHHNLQYKTGLNIDHQKFNPSGNCTSGGIYFSREDIFAFINYGPWIRKVTIPEDARIYENPGEIKKWKADKVILGEREEITVEVIKRLISEGINLKIYNNFPLRWAAKHGHIEIVKLLIPGLNTKSCCNSALIRAAEFGHIDIVKLLIPISDPKVYDSEALRCAIYNRHYEIVKLLIPVSKINNDIIEFCNEYCNNQEILDLIIANKKENK